MSSRRKTAKKALKPVSKKQVDLSQSKVINSISRKVSNLYKSQKADLKYFDYAAAGVSPGSTFTAYCLSDTVQGDTTGNRDGMRISMKNVDLRISLVPSGSAITNTDCMRIMLVRWKSDANGTVPTITEVLSYVANESPLAVPWKGEFKVYYDKVIPLNLQATGQKYIHIKRNLHGALANYSNVTTGYYTDGHLFLILQGQDNVNKSLVTAYSRLTFSG